VLGGFWRLFQILRPLSAKDKKLASYVKNVVGVVPKNLSLYKLAFKHRSLATGEGFKESNERLEYLGDAVLGLVVADLLFSKFPFKDEGFLTEIRSRIVNRESLNILGKKLGLSSILEYSGNIKGNLTHKSLYGDTMEAFIGAVYLDMGFNRCKKFILKKLILPNFDLKTIVDSDLNFKSKLIEWAQRENKEVRFEILEVKSKQNHKEFTAQVIVDNQPFGKGYGYSKKKAEQDAAQKSCEILELT
jgi:ribonuclease III